MKCFELIALSRTACALSIAFIAASCAKQATHDHADHSATHAHADHSATPAHADHPAMPAARTYGEAVKRMQALLVSLDATVKSGKYDAVHDDAEALGDLSKSLAELAAAKDSVVPRDKVNEVADAARQLSVAARSFHQAAHDEDLPHVKEHHANMTRLVESLARHVRKT